MLSLLSFSLLYVVTFEILKSLPPPKLYIACLRFHGHHSNLVDSFIIHNAIKRTHCSILITIPVKNSHRNGGTKHLIDTVFANTPFFKPLNVVFCAWLDLLFF